MKSPYEVCLSLLVIFIGVSLVMTYFVLGNHLWMLGAESGYFVARTYRFAYMAVLVLLIACVGFKFLKRG